ncbi:hypothetical protein [Mucilaginibacter gynuensis]|uniref:hypothetical protein n=1 Tax=Mucilaginibacter gynuensis TaxID=1302236 RepID=UPI0031EFCF1B
MIFPLNKYLINVMLINLIVFISGYALLFQLGYISGIPNSFNVLQFDAKYYLSIRNNGYTFLPEQGCSLAFFPLFPYVWKITVLQPLGISIFNSLLFYVSFYLLICRKQISPGIILILISAPSFVFFMLPYSEAFFFFFGTLLLNGLEKKNKLLTIIGIFGCSLVKPVTVLFVPAILLCELIINNKLEKIQWRYTLLQIFTALAGLFFATTVQAIQTGKWFYSFTIQKYWNRHWLIPKFPLTTFDSPRVLGIDAVAFTIGILALLVSVKWIIQCVFGNSEDEKEIQSNPQVVFSTLFICGTMLLDVLFTFNISDSTNIWSLNRHLFCNPFFICFTIWLLTEKRNSKLDILLFVLTATIGFFITGLYVFPRLAIYFVVFFLSCYLAFRFKEKWLLQIPLYLFNIILIINFYAEFIVGKWLG